MPLGLDLGAASVKGVVTDDGGRVLQRCVAPVTTGLSSAYLQVLDELRPIVGSGLVKVGLTGQGRGTVASHLRGCAVENEVLTLMRGVAAAAPGAASAIEVGGQSSRWVSLEHGSDGKVRLDDFALNDQCAAGAGAFLVQQAARLRLDVGEFSRLAAAASTGASIAGRCAVFARSDMIHLQQRGVPVDDIAYGLCLALARNFTATLLKGRQVRTPVVLVGGGALNAGLVRAFREVLHLSTEECVVLPDPIWVGALGAALGAGESADPVPFDDLALLRPDGRSPGTSAAAPGATGARIEVVDPASSLPDPFPPPCGPFEAWLGVDVGSVSTDFAVVATDGTVLDGLYLPTRGRPIEVLEEGLGMLRARHAHRLALLGLGTTGSGRHLAARLLGADVVRNEITAQLAGALHFFPHADTIIEIGGQDSKFIHAAAHRVADFTMNKVCAAGTGSFLEEQCELLGIDVKRDFAELAAMSTRPEDLGARCTVFMETALVDARRAGTPLPDLVAGLADSVARNYLHLVVAGHAIGRRVVFQGGVASNRAVVAAFERLLGRPVSVHPHNGLSGAIGVALLTRDHVLGASQGAGRPASAATGSAGGPALSPLAPLCDAAGDPTHPAVPPSPATTPFAGGPASRAVPTLETHGVRTFECRACENRCQVTQISVGDRQAFFGDTCERFTIRDSRGSGASAAPPPDLFHAREQILAGFLEQGTACADTSRGVIGLPRASVIVGYLPFWTAFFGSLGFKTVLSPPSSAAILELGNRHLPAETCLPIKMTFGHVASLRGLGVDAIFLPSPLEFGNQPGGPAYSCPYSQSVPYLARSSVEGRILVAEVTYGGGSREFVDAMTDVARSLGIPSSRLAEGFDAARAAQGAFVAAMREEGRRALAGAFERALVALGRPYNLFDPFLNLHLAQHLTRLGVMAIPQGFAPEDEGPAPEGDALLPWHFPREAMRVARLAAQDPRLHLVLVTNFGCGPDAFLQKHLAAALPDRPVLVLEFDEHRGEAGMVTRLEAFLDQVSLPPADEAGSLRAGQPLPCPRGLPTAPLAGRRIFVPYLADHSYALVGALRHQGADAEVLPLTDDDARRAGEAIASGKECHAYAMLVGDLVKLAACSRDARPATFFYPGTSVPCLMSQFAEGLRLDLGQGSLQGIDILAPAWWEMIDLLGLAGADQFWRGLVATDLLVRWVCANRPYEVEPGSVDRVHRENLGDLVTSLETDDIGGFLARSLARMERVQVERSEARPLVGVAGDLYTRVNGVGNLGLWKWLEAHGCEVWPAPFLVDAVEFGLPQEFASSIKAGRYRDALLAGLLTLRKDIKAWRIRRRFSPYLERAREPDRGEVLRLTEPYLGPGTPYPLLLDVAKMVDFARRGADGIIHAICLNCMLGTAASALIERIRRDHGGIPITNMIYAGADTAVLRTRLETFVHQVRAFRESRPKVAPIRPLVDIGATLESWFS